MSVWLAIAAAWPCWATTHPYTSDRPFTGRGRLFATHPPGLVPVLWMLCGSGPAPVRRWLVVPGCSPFSCSEATRLLRWLQRRLGRKKRRRRSRRDWSSRTEPTQCIDEVYYELPDWAKCRQSGYTLNWLRRRMFDFFRNATSEWSVNVDCATCRLLLTPWWRRVVDINWQPWRWRSTIVREIEDALLTADTEPSRSSPADGYGPIRCNWEFFEIHQPHFAERYWKSLFSVIATCNKT